MIDPSRKPFRLAAWAEVDLVLGDLELGLLECNLYSVSVGRVLWGSLEWGEVRERRARSPAMYKK